MALAPPVPVRLTTLPSHDCNYLPGRVATSQAFFATRLPPDLYHRFMDAGYRRSGQVLYQPCCPTCNLCVQLRVPVDRFKPDKSQRRCARQNSDLVVTIGKPALTDEKFDLYCRYLVEWHGKNTQSDLDRDSLTRFLYESPVDTIEFCYRDASGKLLAVATSDICSKSFSSVYLYFDPQEQHRSLGTYSAIYEIEFAKSRQIEFYYLGFWIDGCDSMKYKTRFRPCQILSENGVWKDFTDLPSNNSPIDAIP